MKTVSVIINNESFQVDVKENHISCHSSIMQSGDIACDNLPPNVFVFYNPSNGALEVYPQRPAIKTAGDVISCHLSVKSIDTGFTLSKSEGNEEEIVTNCAWRENWAFLSFHSESSLDHVISLLQNQQIEEVLNYSTATLV